MAAQSIQDALRNFAPTHSLRANVYSREALTSEQLQAIKSFPVRELHIECENVTSALLDQIGTIGIQKKLVYGRFLSADEEWTNDKLGAYRSLFVKGKEPELE